MHSSPFASRQARSFRAPRRAFLSARGRASSTIRRRRSSRGRAAPTAFASSLVHPLPDHADVRAGRFGGVVDRLGEGVPHLSAAGCSCSCSSGCSWFLTCENYTQGRSYRRRRRGAGESVQAHPRRHLPAAHPGRPRHGHPSRCEGGPHPGRRPRLPGELAEEVGEHSEVDPPERGPMQRRTRSMNSASERVDTGCSSTGSGTSAAAAAGAVGLCGRPARHNGQSLAVIDLPVWAMRSLRTASVVAVDHLAWPLHATVLPHELRRPAERRPRNAGLATRAARCHPRSGSRTAQEVPKHVRNHIRIRIRVRTHHRA